MSSIKDQFKSRGIVRGSTLMLRPGDALDVVKLCKARGVEILGIEGFFLSDKSTMPSLNDSINLSNSSSSIDAPDSSWKLAESFLGKYLSSDIYFDVNLQE